jgi:hypothetical protein
MAEEKVEKNTQKSRHKMQRSVSVRKKSWNTVTKLVQFTLRAWTLVQKFALKLKGADVKSSIEILKFCIGNVKSFDFVRRL